MLDIRNIKDIPDIVDLLSTHLGQTENLREQRSLLISELCHAESFVQLASLSVLEIFSW